MIDKSIHSEVLSTKLCFSQGSENGLKMWDISFHSHKNPKSKGRVCDWGPCIRSSPTTVWKTRNFIHAWKIFRENSFQCNLAVDAMISRFQKKKKRFVRVNFRNFHTVSTEMMSFPPHKRELWFLKMDLPLENFQNSFLSSLKCQKAEIKTS